MKTLAEIKVVIDSHIQKCENSCSPSIVELLLKLEGVPSNYYDLQDKYQNQTVGLSFAINQTIHGLTFHQHDEKDGPFADRISSELQARRFVGVYALNPGSNNKYHGWVAVGIQNGALILRSKFSEQGNGEGHRTAENDNINISKAIRPQITDCVYYTLTSHPPKSP